MVYLVPILYFLNTGNLIIVRVRRLKKDQVMEQGQQEYSLQATLALRQISTVSVHSSTVQYCILSKKTQTQRGAGMKHF